MRPPDHHLVPLVLQLILPLPVELAQLLLNLKGIAFVLGHF